VRPRGSAASRGNRWGNTGRRAVAGFYFGTRAVEAGTAAAGNAVQTAAAATTGRRYDSSRRFRRRRLRKTKRSEVDIVTVPPNSPVTWTLAGDEKGEVVQVGPTVFEYRPSMARGDQVVIRFQPIGDPSAFTELIVNKPTTPPPNEGAWTRSWPWFWSFSRVRLTRVDEISAAA
jgi:hypothetical protein